ncbi:MAG: NAD-dependent epimerase/dehydratase family protein [Deltaproteobacteria bacterium]|nr:NAD-dependent epimerase/dehydratase family protein [Deltaproteobacteria bacterium]
MRVFVTGATGFVGVHVVAALRARGHEVACLVRDARKAGALFGDAPPTIVAGGLGDRAALERGAAGADGVVHLAGLVAARSRAELFAVNAGGTRALVDAVRARPGIRSFVHVSSLTAAGPTIFGRAPTGDEPPHPVSDYGRSKLAGEAPVRALAIPWTILRPPAVYGPHDREFLRLFRIARRGVAPMFGDGGQRLSLVYAPDLAAAIAECVERPPAGVYYPAHPTPTTARALVEAIAAALDARVRVVPLPRAIVRPLFFVTGASARLARRATLLSRDKANEILADAWLCSPAALESATGWRAATDLATGLARTAAWYRRSGWL